jgi:enoyl-CoA hydratase/carnithine racemase
MGIVISEDRGRVRHVILNRPDKRNAMSQALLSELRDALRSASDDSSVDCVVLRGEGSVFSAGVDLGELMAFAGDPSVLRPFRNVFLDCSNLCETMLKPVVCQIHGACLGGALEVALGCDLRIASTESKLGLPEVKFGIIPDVGGSSRLPAVVGLSRAKELIMTGKTIEAPEAELVEELLANSPVAVGRAKRVIDASARPALSTTLEMEVIAQEVCVASLRERMRESEPAAAATAAAR